METTLTLDDDVAARPEELSRERNVSLREVANEALRDGLGLGVLERADPDAPTLVVDLGRCLIASLDDTSELLASTDRDFARYPGLRWLNPIA